MRTFTFDEVRHSYHRAIVEGSGVCMEPNKCPALKHMNDRFVTLLDELEESHDRVILGNPPASSHDSVVQARLCLPTTHSTKFLRFEELEARLADIETAGNLRCTLPEDCRARAGTRDRFNQFIDELKSGDGWVMLKSAPKYRLIAKRVSKLERSPARLKRSATELIRQGQRSQIL